MKAWSVKSKLYHKLPRIEIILDGLDHSSAQSLNTELNREANVLLGAQCMVNLSKNKKEKVSSLTGDYTYAITNMWTHTYG